MISSYTLLLRYRLTNLQSVFACACHEVRRIEHDMMPGALVDLGLVDAIEDLAVNTTKEKSLRIDVDDKTVGITLTDFQKIQLYRVIQKCIVNTVKHARATEVSITFETENDLLILTYSDDGKGFDFDAAKASTGLRVKGIVSRVELLKGSVQYKLDQGSIYVISIS